MSVGNAELRHSSERCHFLELPPELILSISKYLRPAEQVLTAFTCRTLFHALRPAATEEVRKLLAHEHEEYLSAMLSGLAIFDRIICAVCHRLHDIEDHDVPGLTKWLKFSGCWPPGAYLANMSKYCLHQRHVQLALRLSQANVRKDRLQQLLQPYHDSGGASFTPMFRETLAQPVIADGSYLLHIRERFRPLYHSEITIGQCRFLEICPHTCVAERFVGHRSSTMLRQALVHANYEQGSQHNGFCTDCATDFCVSITDSGLIVDVWYDFGADPKPSSDRWISHVVNRDHELERDHPMPVQRDRKLREKYERALTLSSCHV